MQVQWSSIGRAQVPCHQWRLLVGSDVGVCEFTPETLTSSMMPAKVQMLRSGIRTLNYVQDQTQHRNELRQKTEFHSEASMVDTFGQVYFSFGRIHSSVSCQAHSMVPTATNWVLGPHPHISRATSQYEMSSCRYLVWSDAQAVMEFTHAAPHVQEPMPSA